MLLPSASAKTFTFNEFLRLLVDAAEHDLLNERASAREVVEQVHFRRGHALPPDVAEADDLPDPIGGTEDDYRDSTARIVKLVTDITALMPRGMA